MLVREHDELHPVSAWHAQDVVKVTAKQGKTVPITVDLG